MSIDAGVGVAAEAMARILQHHKVFRQDVPHNEIETVELGGDLGFIGGEEGSAEGDGYHFITQFCHPNNGQNTVQASGKEGKATLLRS